MILIYVFIGVGVVFGIQRAILYLMNYHNPHNHILLNHDDLEQ